MLQVNTSLYLKKKKQQNSETVFGEICHIMETRAECTEFGVSTEPE
jgi:hypothetical protein